MKGSRPPNNRINPTGASRLRRWNRRPPLRFDEVALPAAAAVSQVRLARRGGWARLSLA